MQNNRTGNSLAGAMPYATSAEKAALEKPDEYSCEQFARHMIERRVLEAIIRDMPERKTTMSITAIGSWVSLNRLWSFTAAVIAALFVLTIASCASLERLPAVPAINTARALPLGLPNARFFLEQREELIAEGQQGLERQRETLGLGPDAPLPPARFLAISGGGDEGAFSSGLLIGWAEAGNRPNFQIVTGVSTGALIAPFAFL